MRWRRGLWAPLVLAVVAQDGHEHLPTPNQLLRYGKSQDVFLISRWSHMNLLGSDSIPTISGGESWRGIGPQMQDSHPGCQWSTVHDPSMRYGDSMLCDIGGRGLRQEKDPKVATPF